MSKLDDYPFISQEWENNGQKIIIEGHLFGPDSVAGLEAVQVKGKMLGWRLSQQSVTGSKTKKRVVKNAKT